MRNFGISSRRLLSLITAALVLSASFMFLCGCADDHPSEVIRADAFPVTKIEPECVMLVGDTLTLSHSDAAYLRSNSRDIVSISDSGELTAVSDGSTVVTCGSARELRIYPVCVRPISTRTIIMSRPEALSDQAEFSDWKSSDTSVAQVSTDGVVNPVSVGEVRISALDADGLPVAWNISVRKAAYLTIDDWPNSVTPVILDILEEYDVTATFFVPSQTYNLHLYQKILDAGHVIGNHTINHSINTIYKSTDAFSRSVNDMDNWLFENFGVRSRLLRFPGGTVGEGVRTRCLRSIQSKGYRVFDWTAQIDDITYSTPEGCYASLVRTATSDVEIILMHNRKHSAAALPDIIEYLLGKGYVFLPLDESCPTYNFVDGWQD